MDNNFNEYRRETVRKSTENEQKRGSVSKVIVIQLVLSLAITAFLYGICRTESNLSNNIKSFYSEISAEDMSVSQILGVFKSVTQVTFAPSVTQNATSVDSDEKGNTTDLNPNEASTVPMGETNANTAGEKAVFSPVFLTVKFSRPIESNNITSYFGYRISPITNKYSLHTGLDIASPQGTKITAVYDGVVEKADYNDTRGNYVVLRHSRSLKTTYNHCSELLVKEGMKIRKGETVALVGSTGAATGNHLHFEVWLNGKCINPLWVLPDGV